MSEKKTEKTVKCVILRDRWDENAVRVPKGTVVEVDPEEAMDGIENGTLARVK